MTSQMTTEHRRRGARPARARARRPRPRRGACSSPRRSRRGSASPRSASSCTPRPVPTRSSRCVTLGLRRVRRPQAARHPDHRRARRARARPPRRVATSTSTPRAASTCCAPGSRGSREGARERGPRRRRFRSRSRCSRAIPTRPRSTRASRARSSRAVAASCARCRRSNACTRARHDFVTIVPGVRLADGDVHDQARVGTPDAGRGARAPTCSCRTRGHARPTDPRAAAQRVHDAVADALTSSTRSARDRRVVQAVAQLRRGAVSLCCTRCRSGWWRSDDVDRNADRIASSHVVARLILEEHHGEPAHAHTGAASARAREGRQPRAVSAPR